MANKRAAIYTRISLDRAGDSTSPARQEALCRQMAKDRGFDVVAVHSDRDLSAWRRGVKRPGWDALLEAVKRREFDVVMGYSLTRFGRRTRDLLQFTDTLQAHDCALVMYDQSIDTTTPAGVMLFTMIAGFAQLESEQTSARVKSAHLVAAAQGKAHLGGSRCFGYQRDGSVDDREAGAVRAVSSRLLQGESLSSCARWLNGEDVLTTGGHLWTSGQLGQALRAPRLAGLRQHGDRVLPGNWEPVIPEADWLRLMAELDSRKNKGAGRTTPAHLLTGLIRCGRCGQKLRAASFTQTNGKLFDRYQCLPRPGLPNCGTVAASKRSVDAYVTEAFMVFMSAASLRVVDDDAKDLAGDIADVEAKLGKLAHDHYVEAKLPESVFVATHDELSRRLTDLQAAQRAQEQARALNAGALRPGSRKDIEAWWAAASLEDRRQALARAIIWIEIMPAAHRGGNVFDTNRVSIEWSTAVYRALSKSRHPQNQRSDVAQVG